jgi:hypothetical protein
LRLVNPFVNPKLLLPSEDSVSRCLRTTNHLRPDSWTLPSTDLVHSSGGTAGRDGSAIAPPLITLQHCRTALPTKSIAMKSITMLDKLYLRSYNYERVRC